MRVIELDRVGLSYRLERAQSASLKEHVIRGLKRQVRYERLAALTDVTVSVAPGELLGVIGANGAGKSTLLRVIGRVLPPTVGRVVVRGAVSPLIELGTGFNGDLTGYENLVLYGALLGREPAAMRRRAESIADWAGLGDYLDVPLRAYSSGMTMRLAFAVATDVRPEVLLIDEILAVGDEAFQAISGARIADMIDHGTAVVLVTHQMPVVLERADRVLWLDRGQVRALGEPADVVDRYLGTSAMEVAK